MEERRYLLSERRKGWLIEPHTSPAVAKIATIAAKRQFSRAGKVADANTSQSDFLLPTPRLLPKNERMLNNWFE